MNVDLKDFKFKHSYGQNFIFDTNFLTSIVNTIGVDNENVLEIGAGAGTLTSIICKSAKKVVAYEIDETLKPILSKTLKNFNNIELCFEDIMKVDVESIEKKFDGNYQIVANLPYYITTPIIFKFIENATKLSSMSIMVQLEVAERLTAKPNTKDYGAITPAIDYRGNAKIIKRVSKNMFTPIPKVDSAIVKIDFVKDKYNILSTQILDKTIKAIFSMRRKTIENNLKSAFGLDNDTISDILNKANISRGLRGETLDTKTIVDLANQIYLTQKN